MTLIEAIERVLERHGRAMNAKDLASKIDEIESATLGGRTPWKTVGARLAEDIRTNPTSVFLRVGRGIYGLRRWPGITDFEVRTC